MSSVLVVSPHLDDAVLSTGEYLGQHPGATVVTVFAGVPGPEARGHYDAATGAANGAEMMTRRRQEDALALGLLGATPLHLEFLDRQYRVRSSDDAIAARLRETIESCRPDVVLGPVGLLHPDHVQVARVWSRVAREFAGIVSLAYEELPYRVQFPTLAVDQVRATAKSSGAKECAQGNELRPDNATGRKAQAILAYGSQLGTLPMLSCLVPERLWRLWPEPERADAGVQVESR